MEPPCQRCGARPAALIDSNWQLGMIIYRREFQTLLVLCRHHARSQTTVDLIKTLLLGWWGVISVLTNTLRVPLQISECAKARRIPEADTTAGAGSARRGLIASENRNSVVGLGAVGAAGVILVAINLMGPSQGGSSIADPAESATHFNSTTPYIEGGEAPPSTLNTGDAYGCSSYSSDDCALLEDSVRPSGPTSETVVQDYFAAINRHDYQSAYALGGSNLDPSYEHFATGFSTTAQDTWNLNDKSADGTMVYGQLVADQTDGTAEIYAGYYVVVNGLITDAHLERE